MEWMPDVIRYHLDENVDHAVAHGLRLRGLDVTTTTDTEDMQGQVEYL